MATTITTFSPEVARQICNYIREQLSLTPPGSNPISGNYAVRRKAWAKVTGSLLLDGVYSHSWIEMRWNFDDLIFETAPDGRQGDTITNYIINWPYTDTAIGTNSIIEITSQEDPDTGENIWLANSSEALGQYPGMVHQITAANTGGWDWLHAHSLLG